MKDHDFRQLVDREFAPLEWTDEQRLAALQQMKKEVQPIMKRKFVIALALVISIMLMSTAAIAVTLSIPSIQDFMDWDELRMLQQSYGYEPFKVDVNAVVKPTNQRQTSQFVNVEIHEAYLTTEAFYITAHVTPKSENTVLFTENLTTITRNGQELRYFDLYKDETQMLFKVSGFRIDSPYPDSDYSNTDYTLKLAYMDQYRVPEDNGITFMMAYIVPNDLTYLFSGSTLMCKFIVDNARTRDWEFNAIYFDIPKLTQIDATDSRITR